MLHTQLFLQNKRWQVIIDFHIHPQLKSFYCPSFTTCYLRCKKNYEKFVYVEDLLLIVRGKNEKILFCIEVLRCVELVHGALQSL